MLVQRRGLSVRTNSFSVSKTDGCEEVGVLFLFIFQDIVKPRNVQKTVVKNEDKENANAKPKMSAKESSLMIYKDTPSQICQHCGVDRSSSGKSFEMSDSSTQTTQETVMDLKEFLCSG